MAKDPSHTPVSASAQSQAQMGSAEPDYKEKNDPAKKENADEIQFFDTTISKQRKNDDGEWETVMSDNLYPGEKLTRVMDEEKAEEKAKLARKNAADRAAKDDK